MINKEVIRETKTNAPVIRAQEFDASPFLRKNDGQTNRPTNRRIPQIQRIIFYM